MDNYALAVLLLTKLSADSSWMESFVVLTAFEVTMLAKKKSCRSRKQTTTPQPAPSSLVIHPGSTLLHVHGCIRAGCLNLRSLHINTYKCSPYLNENAT
jgi:hypothetical protein